MFRRNSPWQSSPGLLHMNFLHDFATKKATSVLAAGELKIERSAPGPLLQIQPGRPSGSGWQEKQMTLGAGGGSGALHFP